MQQVFYLLCCRFYPLAIGGKLQHKTPEEIWATVKDRRSPTTGAHAPSTPSISQAHDKTRQDELGVAPLPSAIEAGLSRRPEAPQTHDTVASSPCINPVVDAVPDKVQEQHGQQAAQAPVPSFILDRAQRLDIQSFPDAPQGRIGELPATIANTRRLLDGYGITVRYNVIKKKLLITLPGHAGTSDNADNTAMTQIISLAILNGMAFGQIPSYIEFLADRNLYNPVADWILSKDWDGIDRLPAVFDTLTEREGFPAQLKRILVYKWLLSAVAAALKPNGFKGRGVLTFQGPQGIGKTSWVISLVPDPMLREMVVKVDHHLDAGNKDSILGAVTHWIVEIGELDSSFRKDIARLKGVLTSDSDKVRRPYARTESEYPRRTVLLCHGQRGKFLGGPDRKQPVVDLAPDGHQLPARHRHATGVCSACRGF
ncbi:MAG: VapE domain-containing protein [Bifidobacterium adolescentis]